VSFIDPNNASLDDCQMVCSSPSGMFAPGKFNG
jgi:hypothetical protein